MSPEQIVATFSALTTLLAGLTGVVITVQKKMTKRQRADRVRIRLLEEQLLALTKHTFRLEMEVARHGGDVPARPAILETIGDESTDE